MCGFVAGNLFNDRGVFLGLRDYPGGLVTGILDYVFVGQVINRLGDRV